MVDANGRLYLIDFGASKQLHSVDGRTLATSAAMALTLGCALSSEFRHTLYICSSMWANIGIISACSQEESSEFFLGKRVLRR
ncbi:MAG: hypothetical protein J6I31_04560 [Prevotella sp.]|nr:hypothetical protein [Prevotella sp.]